MSSQGDLSGPPTYKLVVDRSMAMLETISPLARPPMTSIYIHANTKSQRKLILREEGGDSNLPHTNATAGQGWRPDALNALDKGEREEAAGQTIFCIGSLEKHLIILAFLILEERGELTPVTLRTPTRLAYNEAVNAINEPRIAQFSREPAIGQTAVHYDSFAPANRFLFSPDGQFLASDDGVIKNVAEITEIWRRSTEKDVDTSSANVAYSNMNYAVLALILVKRCQKPIGQILQDVLFKPLDMTRTTLCRSRLEELAAGPAHNVAQGFRMSADLRRLNPIPSHDYMSNTVAQATVGAWSCTDDLAKLYKEIFKGYREESKIFSRKITVAFLAPRIDTGKHKPHITFAGYMCESRSHHLGCDSLNKDLGMAVKPYGKPLERLFRRSSSQEQLHYKGGTADGFTSSVYLCVSEGVFAIALSNCTGPFDFSEPAARCITQEILLGAPPAHLVTDVEEHLRKACATWRQLELEHENLDGWVDNLSTFAGRYTDGVTGRTIEVEHENVVFCVGNNTLCRIKAAAHGNRLRLLPESPGVFVDRVTSWRDLVFELRRDGSRVSLIGHNGAEHYVKDEP